MKLRRNKSLSYAQEKNKYKADGKGKDNLGLEKGIQLRDINIEEDSS